MKRHSDIFEACSGNVMLLLGKEIISQTDVKIDFSKHQQILMWHNLKLNRKQILQQDKAYLKVYR